MNRSRAPRFLLFVALAAPLAAQSTDPRLTSWLTEASGSYARVYQTNADKSAGTTSTTWPRAGLLNRGTGSVSTATYTDVQRVAYSANYVYVQTTGLASYTMGPWYDVDGTTLFGMWPKNRAAIHQIPRNPAIPTTKSLTRGVGGVLVNGVFLWNNGDAQSYSTSTGTVSFNGQGIWNRLAGPTEGPTFDAANAHQPQDGQYHNHINPRALRYQLGDAVTFDATTQTYSEATPTKHSPIIGWANDGLPIYGPYGYSTASNAASGVRRMTSGFVKRDGTNGTTNLALTGRTTLPVWAASVQNRSQTLASNQYGPGTATTAIGTFAEDYEYLGDLGKTQGVDFDLNRQNVRFCVTPEFPSGTYAYFTCIDASGNSVFPDVINQEFFGTPASTQGTVTSISETVTEYVRGGPAAALTLTGTASGTGVALKWNSADGATYKVESSSDNAAFTTLSSAVTSGGIGTTYTAAATANYFRVTLTAIATYDTAGTTGVPVGTTATLHYTGTGSTTTGATNDTASTGGTTTTTTPTTTTTTTGTTSSGSTSSAGGGGGGAPSDWFALVAAALAIGRAFASPAKRK